jgi:PPP family 3-phenylpropionic acid transporter
MVVVVSLFQAAALAPLVPLADALSLAHARSEQDGKPGGFEYGWVRGAGSAAFVVGTLLAGQVAGTHGLSAVIWLSAVCLLATSIAAILVPEFPAGPATGADARSARVPWLALFRQRAFVRVVVIAALVLGSHAMFDSFAVIRWTDAGISPATTAVLWSESVAAEVLVFLFILHWSSPCTGSPSRCCTSHACASSRLPCRGICSERRRPSMASSELAAPLPC